MPHCCRTSIKKATTMKRSLSPPFLACVGPAALADWDVARRRSSSLLLTLVPSFSCTEVLAAARRRMSEDIQSSERFFFGVVEYTTAPSLGARARLVEIGYLPVLEITAYEVGDSQRATLYLRYCTVMRKIAFRTNY